METAVAILNKAIEAVTKATEHKQEVAAELEQSKVGIQAATNELRAGKPGDPVATKEGDMKAEGVENIVETMGTLRTFADILKAPEPKRT